MAKIVFGAVGKCIYCGHPPVVPSVEHIIPESLNGQMELPNYSCRKFAAEILKYEGVVARAIFRDFTIRHNLRSRRPKNRRPKDN